MNSIQKGTKLKKAVTVDKSGPMISGRVTNDGAALSNSSRLMRPPKNEFENVNTIGPMKPKLTGIFEGLSEMPRLKPVGSRSEKNYFIEFNQMTYYFNSM